MNNFLGEIVILPFGFAPRGFDFCNGQLLPISQYSALYSLIGTAFGGDGNTTFALPDYHDQAPAGSQYFIAIEGTYPHEPGKQ
jgi:microcystin-dependent protein